MSRLVVLVAAALVLAGTGCVPDGTLKRNFDVVPEQLNDGWQVASPEEAGLDTGGVMAAYRQFWDEGAYYNARSLLVVRHGKLVFENYCRDAADRDTVQHIQSVTKSVTSLALGICRDRGWFGNLDTPLYDVLPDKFPDDTLKRRITVRHLLTMMSGIAFDNDDYSDEVLKQRPADLARYILAKPMYAAPGDSFYYRDCDPQLVSCAVQAVTGRTLADVARTELFAPLGITDAFWESNCDGSSQGGHGLFVTPRDMAKLGQLVLNRGTWNGQRVVSDGWVGQSTSSQTGRVPGIGDLGDAHYGFYWWVLVDRGVCSAWGHGGQFIYVVPDKDLVLVMTSMPSSNDDYVSTRLPDFLPLADLIAAAVTD